MGVKYKLRDDCFLVGNNCAVGWVYKMLLQLPYETPFVWNYFTHEQMFRLSRVWDDIDWKAQEWTPREVGSFKEMQTLYDGFFATRPNFPIEMWWDLKFHANDGQCVKMLLPHLDLRDGAEGHGKLARRVERFLKALETKQPVFAFTRNYDDKHWTEEQERIIAEDPRCVLCDFQGKAIPAKWMASSVVLPKLLERGFIKTVEE